MAADFSFVFTCTTCGNEDVTADVSVQSFGSLPIFLEPGVGPEYSIDDATCTECGETFTSEWIEDTHWAKLSQRIAEQEEPDYD